MLADWNRLTSSAVIIHATYAFPNSVLAPSLVLGALK